MRTLCVAGVYPWPANDGYRLRLTNMIDTFRDLGEVDVACVRVKARDEGPPPDGVRMLSLEPNRLSRPGRLRAWAKGDLPRSLCASDVAVANAQIMDWAADHYDLVYFSHMSSWSYHRSLSGAPAIVDLDNLDHVVIRMARRTRPVAVGWKGWAKWLALQPLDWIDERRMARTEQRCAADVGLVTLCSQLDVDRSGMPNAIVVPNGYDRLGQPPEVRTGAAMVFVGSCWYPPNADAVRWFATDVLPRVRREMPDAVFRAVGGGQELLADLAHLDGVSLAGRVDNVQSELDAAAIAVVPIRFGSGTRLKVVEALANRLPMASTTIGAEGIGVVGGTHALLADDADGLAAACVRLLRDPELGRRLAAAGEELWAASYRWAEIRSHLAEAAGRLAKEDVGGATP